MTTRKVLKIFVTKMSTNVLNMSLMILLFSVNRLLYVFYGTVEMAKKQVKIYSYFDRAVLFCPNCIFLYTLSYLISEDALSF